MLVACGSTEDTVQRKEEFPVTAVIAADTFAYTYYVAEIHALQNVEIRARVNGYLEQIHVDEGAYVKKDQLLFSINHKEYAEELEKARAIYKTASVEVQAAELELKSVLQLGDKKIVSPLEVELAKNKLEAQKARMEEARANMAHAGLRLSFTEVRAPFNGIINRIPHKIGSLVDEGLLLTTISENDEVYAYFDVSEKEYLNYARSQSEDSTRSREVELVLADGNVHPQKGYIETVEGIIDKNTGNIAFRARFKNPGKIIKHGASGKVRLHKDFKNALIIPQKSVFEIQDKQYVFKLDRNDRLHMQNIETAYRMPHLYILSKGLKAGDRIVYEGIQNVKAGMSIKPRLISIRNIMQELTTGNEYSSLK